MYVGSYMHLTVLLISVLSDFLHRNKREIALVSDPEL